MAGSRPKYSGSNVDVHDVRLHQVAIARLATTLFGGWQVPFLYRDGFHFPGGVAVAVPSLVVTLLQVVSFLVKLFVFCWIQILIRWSVPRLRYDQLMTFGWKRLLPVGLANVTASAVLVLWLEGWTAA